MKRSVVSPVRRSNRQTAQGLCGIGCLILVWLALPLASGAETADAGSDTSAAGKVEQPKAKRIKHTSGLIVVLVEPGEGEAIEKGQTAVVHYTGWLDAGAWEPGTKFDSSRDRSRPFSVRNVGSGPVIRGWNDGIAPHRNLAGMRVGEKRRLLIPPHLGYGARGAPPKIPPNARLIFDVELLEIR